MNKCIFIGNLVRDPENRATASGKQRVVFTIAINRNHTDADGNRQADFIQITCYEKTAELVSKYLAKGRKVAVEARVRTGSYEKDGHTVYTTDFIADRVEFLSPANNGGTGATYGTRQQASGAGYIEDELPF